MFGGSRAAGLSYHLPAHSTKKLGTKQKKPYTAVTVQVERLTSEQYEENDLGGIVDLVEAIKLHDAGPAEAARALRKKLKYGNAHRQLRALTVLDGLVGNAGPRVQRAFADESLLERLRILARDDMVDVEVRTKCNSIVRQWAVSYKNTPGMERIAALYRELPHKSRAASSQSNMLKQRVDQTHQASSQLPASSAISQEPRFSRSALASPSASGPSASSDLSFRSDKFSHGKPSKKSKPFNLEKERPKLLETIATASVASTNLLNALKLINHENQRVSNDKVVMDHFQTCKSLRKQILHYIQVVESERYIGSLLSANDEVVKALQAFEIMDKSIDDDSDSEVELETSRTAAFGSRPESDSSQAHSGAQSAAATTRFRTARPETEEQGAMHTGNDVDDSSGPAEFSDEEVDEDNPFGDQNAVKTPFTEPRNLSWNNG